MKPAIFSAHSRTMCAMVSCQPVPGGEIGGPTSYSRCHSVVLSCLGSLSRPMGSALVAGHALAAQEPLGLSLPPKERVAQAGGGTAEPLAAGIAHPRDGPEPSLGCIAWPGDTGCVRLAARRPSAGRLSVRRMSQRNAPSHGRRELCASQDRHAPQGVGPGCP